MICLLGVLDVGRCKAQEEEPAAPAVKQYKQLKVNGKLKGDRSDVSRMLRDGIPGDAAGKFDAYYKEYFFPQWTVAKNFPGLAKLRKSLRSDFSAARDAGAYKHLLDLSLDHLTTLATTPDFHPAVRFNATVMLGGLNSKATPRGADPVAYSKSLPVLVKLLEDDNENDAARFGALLGVIRHAQFNTDEASRPEITDALIAQASLSQSPSGRPDEGHEWLRSKAIEGLSFAKGDQAGKVAPILEKIVNSPVEPESIRLAAATSLGRLPLAPESDVNVSQTVRTLAKFASDAVREEVEACEQDLTKTIDPVGLKMNLLPIRIALTGQDKSVTTPTGGLAAAAVEKDQMFLKNVWKPIEEWYGKLDNKDLMVSETQPGGVPGMMGPMMDRGMMGRGMMAGGQKTPARVATEELIEYFNLELKKMENLLGGAK